MNMFVKVHVLLSLLTIGYVVMSAEIGKALSGRELCWYP